MKTITYKLPAYWASYLVNGDTSSLRGGEYDQINYFLSCRNLGSPCWVSDSYFSHSNDAHTGLSGDVCDYKFWAPKKTRLITIDRAKQITGNWHGGQWSALYSFASTGRFAVEHTLQYFKDIETALRPDFALHPGSLFPKKSERELNSLKKFMLNEARENGYPVEFEPHKVYGYLIPYLLECIPDDKAKKVEQVTYLA